MKTLKIRERNRRKYLSMHKSLKNKMLGTNLVWFDGLSQKAQYSLLFKWMSFSSSSKSPKLKHFLKIYKGSYNPSKSNYRNSLINHIIHED